MSRKRLSIRARLTMWYATTLAVLLLVLGVGLEVLVHNSLETHLHAQLDKHLDAAVAALRTSPDAIAEVDRHGTAGLFRIAQGGRIIHQSHTWEDQGPSSDGIDASSVQLWTTAGLDGLALKVLRKSVRVRDSEFEFVVAVPEEEAHQALETVRRFLMIGALVALVASIAGGYFLADRLLQPLRTISIDTTHGLPHKVDGRTGIDSHLADVIRFHGIQ